MTTILLIGLFITQIISFYFIALLYMKVANFDALEKKQNRLMQEMDDAIAAYLAEIKDENDQLLEKLTMQADKQNHTQEVKKELQEKQDKVPFEAESPVQVTTPQQSMRHYARKSYATTQHNRASIDKQEDVDERTRALQLSEDGWSIEEIAKKLDKGRTEIELILKFK